MNTQDLHKQTIDTVFLLEKRGMIEDAKNLMKSFIAYFNIDMEVEKIKKLRNLYVEAS